MLEKDKERKLVLDRVKYLESVQVVFGLVNMSLISFGPRKNLICLIANLKYCGAFLIGVDYLDEFLIDETVIVS